MLWKRQLILLRNLWNGTLITMPDYIVLAISRLNYDVWVRVYYSPLQDPQG